MNAGNEILDTMSRYNQWANAELINAVRSLPNGAAISERPSLFKSIVNTLNHPLVTDNMWWAHMHNEPHSHKALNEVLFADFEELATARTEMDLALVGFVARLSEAQADEKIEFTLLSGVAGTMSKTMILMHMFNHNSFHRGFVVETFCQIPAPIPVIDLPVFLRGASGLRFAPPHLSAAE